MPSKNTTEPKKATEKKTVKKPAASKAKANNESRLDSAGHFVPYVEKKSEKYMSPAMQGHFRDILNNWKTELMEEVDRTVHHMQDEAANFPDPNDRASQESDFTMELRTRDRERKLLKKINEALDLLDDGEYGYCESCGVEIGLRRLEARPTATLCIDCKTLDEIREKQRG
jgi:DnaK suppressor protein